MRPASDSAKQINSAVADLTGATTYAIGRVFVKHFEDGGSILNFSKTR
jgi:hypothetical protein